jgi:hypothetical protein
VPTARRMTGCEEGCGQGSAACTPAPPLLLLTRPGVHCGGGRRVAHVEDTGQVGDQVGSNAIVLRNRGDSYGRLRKEERHIATTAPPLTSRCSPRGARRTLALRDIWSKRGASLSDNVLFSEGHDEWPLCAALLAATAPRRRAGRGCRNGTVGLAVPSLYSCEPHL